MSWHVYWDALDTFGFAVHLLTVMGIVAWCLFVGIPKMLAAFDRHIDRRVGRRSDARTLSRQSLSSFDRATRRDDRRPVSSRLRADVAQRYFASHPHGVWCNHCWKPLTECEHSAEFASGAESSRDRVAAQGQLGPEEAA